MGKLFRTCREPFRKHLLKPEFDSPTPRPGVGESKKRGVREPVSRRVENLWKTSPVRSVRRTSIWGTCVVPRGARAAPDAPFEVPGRDARHGLAPGPIVRCGLDLGVNSFSLENGDGAELGQVRRRTRLHSSYLK